MNLYNILTISISITAIFSYINYRFIKLPATIGIMILSLSSSLMVVIAGKWIPAFSTEATDMVAAIDFEKLLMKVMLSFLLFAGAIHIDIKSLKKERTPIIALASVGVILSTFAVGSLLYLVFSYAGAPIAFIHCLLFGALISPTDPIAVLGILKTANIPKSLEVKISGESLFNDGVAVVVFMSILEVAEKGVENFSLAGIALLFAKEAIGGLVFGLVIGYLGFRMMRSIDNYKVEVMITIAIVMGGYTLADYLHVSGPLAMVTAGILIGNKGKAEAMSDITRDYVGKFWELIDEILNALLFLLIGFEMLVVKLNIPFLLIGGAAIIIILLSRWVSVFVPMIFLKRFVNFEKHAIKMLTWGALRGGISVALALSLPHNIHKDVFVSITYIVVIFSISVQGLTIGTLAKKLCATNCES